MNIYIYTLSDDKNNIKYVGQTNNIERRLNNHIYEANNNGGKNKRCSWVKSLLNKNNKPKIDIIDIVPIEEWMFWETYWITQIKSWGFSLVNMTNGGDGKYGYTPSNETIKKISDSHKGKTPKNIDLFKFSRNKKILQYDLNGNFIKEWESISEAEKTLNIRNISGVIRGKRLKSGDSIWTYKDKPLTKEYYNKIKIKMIDNRKKILQYTINGDFIKEWESVRNVKKIYPHIPSVLSGKRKTAGGFCWKYKE